jgi:multicomponent K+:H+ antiporter subunit D
MPPLSGFIGKLLILDATRSAPGAVWIWATLLVTSLIIIAGFARAGSLILWRCEEKAAGADRAATDSPVARASLVPLAAVIALLSTTALMALFAGPVTAQMDRTAAQILDRTGYVRAVLGTDAPARFARIPEGR